MTSWPQILCNKPWRQTATHGLLHWGRDKNGHQFPDDILNGIFSNENIQISIKISLKFVPRSPINNIPALVQIMAWCRPGDKPLSEPVIVSRCSYASLGLNELRSFSSRNSTMEQSGHWLSTFIIYVIYITLYTLRNLKSFLTDPNIDDGFNYV